MSEASTDRFLYWPIIPTLVWPLIFALVWSGPFALTFLGAPIVLALWASSGCAVLLLSTVWVYERAWRRAFSMLIFPATVLIGGLNLSFVWGMGQLAGDYIHFFVVYPRYTAEIAAMPPEERKFVVFDWGGFIVGRGVVYDESDELASDHPSEAWWERAKQHGIYGYGPRAFGHFYFVATH